MTSINEPILHKESDDTRQERLKATIALQMQAVVEQIQKYESGREQVQVRSPGGIYYDATSDVLRRLYTDLAELRREQQALN